MISASHNTFEFNGIKFFSDQGYKLLDETEEMIEKLVEDDSGTEFPLAENIGRRKVLSNAKDDYINYLASTVNTDFKGLKIVLDFARSILHCSTRMFEMLGADVNVIKHTPTYI